MSPSKPFDQMTQQERDNFIAASNAFYKKQNELSAPKEPKGIGLDPYSMVKPDVGLDPNFNVFVPEEPIGRKPTMEEMNPGPGMYPSTPMPTPKPVSPRLAQQQARQAHLNELRAIHAQRRADRDAKRALRNAPVQPKAPFNPYDGDDFIPRSVVPEDVFGNAPIVGGLNSKSNLDKMNSMMEAIARMNNQPQVDPKHPQNMASIQAMIDEFNQASKPKSQVDPKYLAAIDGYDSHGVFPMQPQGPTGTGNAPYNPYAGMNIPVRDDLDFLSRGGINPPMGGNDPYNPFSSMGGGMKPPMGGIGSLSGGIGGLGSIPQSNPFGVMPAQNNMLGQSTNTPVKPPNPMGMKKGGAVKKFAKGGAIKKSKSSKPMVSNASKRGDGIAQRGKTKGRIV
jgi:hypothetical protein